MSTYSDEEIGNHLLHLGVTDPVTDSEHDVRLALGKSEEIIRQLLSEVRKLREEQEPCPHEEVEEAGAIWWRCCQCGAYIERQNPDRSQDGDA